MIKRELGSVCSRLSSGKSIRAENINPIGAYPVIGGNGLRGYTDSYNFDGECAVIGRQGAACGNVRYHSGKAYMTEHAVVVCANDENDTRYLSYLLSIQNLGRLSAQSAQPGISVKTLSKQEVCLPPLDEQKRVSQLLGTIDSKINANTKLNDYLTTLASAIYREFVSHASGSMGVLADLVDLRKDSTKAGKRPELPYLPIDAIPMKSIGISEFKPNHEAKSSLQLFQRDDIIIGAMRVYFHRVVLAPCEGITRNTCFVLRPKNQLLREYALLTCFQPEAIEYANARAKGSTMPYAVWEGSFEAYPVLIPDESELEMFSKRVSPIIDKLRDSFDENGRLAKLRDALLPKLMSGEIDVSKVEMPTQPNNHLSAD